MLHRLDIAIIAIMATSFCLSGQNFPVDTIQYHGDPEKIINLVVLPDGYRESELDKFTDDARSVTNELFDQSPFKEYKSYFNVFAIKVPSLESGATHPGTATDVDEPLIPVKTVNNRFGSRFDFSNIHRLLVPTKTFEINNVLANNFPLYDQKLIIVNTPFYGGSGGSNATTSLDKDASEIAFHELGHSFAGLSDEYYAGDQFARESPNMTADTDPETVRWKNWYGDESIGIFQHCCGGNSSNWYRPHNNCKMRFLNRSFCAVCLQQIVESIHFLTPPVYDFEPKERFLTGFDLPVTFRLDLLKPNPNTLEVKWHLNSEELEIYTDSLILSDEMLVDGLNILQSSVEDQSEFLRVDNHAAKHLYLTSWEIEKSTTSITLQDYYQLDMTVFPNPTTDRLTIHINSSKKEDFTLKIMGMDGVEMLSGKIKNNEMTIDISSFPSNQYILSILSARSKIHSQIITKI